MTAVEVALVRGHDWRDAAACRTADPDLFYPTLRARGQNAPEHDYDSARQICAVCPVAEPCLRFALDNGEPDGMWGMMTPRQRAALRPPRRRGP